METTFFHQPVLVRSVVHFLNVQREGLFVDCTLGGGGHTEALLAAGGPGVRVIGIDRDPRALAAAKERLARWADRVQIMPGNFRYLPQILDSLGVEQVDGILADLGVSSHHVDVVERGFSYWGDGPLDMRMGPDAKRTAAELLAQLDEAELAKILREYGEERFAVRIAREIVAARRREPIVTAAQLVEVVKRAIPAAARRSGPHPARRTFQALRIAVNDELGALRDLLSGAVERLARAGRIVVISFHSLEDRIVKEAFAREARGCTCPPELPACVCGRRPRLRILTRKPVVADDEEIARNPRSRSAKLRAAECVLAMGEGE